MEKNDTFEILGLENFPGTQLQIYNRWGAQVFADPAYENNWEGMNMNGEPLSNDTYFYHLKFENGDVFKGYLVLKR